jgi:hypothetical protein
MDSTELFRLALRAGFVSALGVGLVTGVFRHLQRTDYQHLWPTWAPGLAGAATLGFVVLFPFGWEWLAQTIVLWHTGRILWQEAGDPTRSQLLWLIGTTFCAGLVGLIAGPFVRDRVWM